MKVGILAALTLAMAASCAWAQDSNRAGQQIGQALFGAPRNDDAYIRGMAEGAMARQAIENSLSDARARGDAQMRQALESNWQRAGFSTSEAHAIAGAYHYDPAEEAIIARAKRDGSRATFVAVAQAYKDYNYLLANQLLIGALLTSKAEREAAQQ